MDEKHILRAIDAVDEANLKKLYGKHQLSPYIYTRDRADFESHVTEALKRFGDGAQFSDVVAFAETSVRKGRAGILVTHDGLVLSESLKGLELNEERRNRLEFSEVDGLGAIPETDSAFLMYTEDAQASRGCGGIGFSNPYAGWIGELFRNVLSSRLTLDDSVRLS